MVRILWDVCGQSLPTQWEVVVDDHSNPNVSQNGRKGNSSSSSPSFQWSLAQLCLTDWRIQLTSVFPHFQAPTLRADMIHYLVCFINIYLAHTRH